MGYLKYILQQPLRYPTYLSVVRDRLPQLMVIRSTTSKDGDGAPDKKQKVSKPHGHPGHDSKEELNPTPTPGFVRPEVFCEDGLFTQKASQQIEERKKKQSKPSLNNPETRS